MLVFLLCAASFAVVLVLGGGPQATTLEVAIYQALRLDFDPARASALALAQVMLCSVLVAAGGRALLSDSGVAISMPIRLSVLPDTSLNRWIDFTAIALLLLVVLPPTLAIVASGLMSWPQAGAVVPAALTSLLLGTAAALFALVLCWPLAAFAARSTSPSARTWSTMLSLSAWMLPPAVLATGWFIALLPFQIGILGTALLIAAMNALMALPFVYGNLWQAMADRAKQHDRLCASLGLAGWQRLRLVDLPSLKSPLMLASVMAFAVSLGDLAAVTLFGAGDITTLPALIYRQMGSYRMEQAASTALFLAAGCLASMWAAEKWARKV
jgi:thiamine transport system permease protein